MSIAVDAVDAAIVEVGRVRTNVLKIKSVQVRATDDLASLSATASAWFKTHRLHVAAHPAKLDLSTIDRCYQAVLDSTSRHASKITYLDELKLAKAALVVIRGTILTFKAEPLALQVKDLPPDFTSLVGNPEMRDVLTRRWNECQKCVDAGAHLAAIVMMGGLLEAMFVARANKLVDKIPLVKAMNAPIDKMTKKAVNYQEWMLDSYIKVGNELRWITNSAKDVADVLKEYRNYIHPAKELRHNVVLAHNDSSILWDITKGLVRQLLLSAA